MKLPSFYWSWFVNYLFFFAKLDGGKTKYNQRNVSKFKKLEGAALSHSLKITKCNIGFLSKKEMTLLYNLAENSNSEIYNFEIKVSTKFLFYCLIVCKQDYSLTG